MKAQGVLTTTVLLALAACSIGGNDNGMITVTANSQDGNVSVRVPGVSIDTKLPSAMFKQSDFDIDGVKLFPGSSIETMNVNANSKKGETATVDITFSAPTGIDAVRKHFVDGFAREEIAVKTYDGSLMGKTDDGNEFAIDFFPIGANVTKGHVTITDSE
ncbi:MAG: hypothetical protein ABI898_04285 [Sphingomonadales bacterium]